MKLDRTTISLLNSGMINARATPIIFSLSTATKHNSLHSLYNINIYFYEKNINILDISQKLMQNLFTMIALVDLSGSELGMEELTREDMLMRVVPTEHRLVPHPLAGYRRKEGRQINS